MTRILLAMVLSALVACEKAPFSPQTATITVEVGGMLCQGCAMEITEAVEKLDGVKSCDVSFAGSSAEVELDPAWVTAAQVTAVIAGLGYQAALPGQAEPDPVTTERSAEPTWAPPDVEPASERNVEPAPDDHAPATTKTVFP